MPAHIVVGLGFGDEGKGLVVDHLVRQHKASAVIRYNGGAQAAHNVVLPNGTHHTFSQFSAGTLAGAMTYLSKHMLVNPHALFNEWEKLREIGHWPEGRIAVQKSALVTTPIHIAANRLREHLRGISAHGTCGMGIGETVMAARAGEGLLVEELDDPKIIGKKLWSLQQYYQEEFRGVQLVPRYLLDPFFSHEPLWEAQEIYRIFSKVVPIFDHFEFSPDEHIVFEGAQGVLLDEYYGFHPHTTWSKTTDRNARDLLDEMNYQGEIKTIGVTRSYMTRHGAGPFVTEDPDLHELFPEAHNGSEGFQGAWRVGWTDLRAISYSLSVMNVDELAITHLDRVKGDWKICSNYSKPLGAPMDRAKRENWLKDRAWALEQITTSKPIYEYFDAQANDIPDDLVGLIEAEFDIPVTIRSYGPTHEDVQTHAYT